MRTGAGIGEVTGATEDTDEMGIETVDEVMIGRKGGTIETGGGKEAMGEADMTGMGTERGLGVIQGVQIAQEHQNPLKQPLQRFLKLPRSENQWIWVGEGECTFLHSA